MQRVGSTSGNRIQNHSSVAKVVQKKSSDVLGEKNVDAEWTTNENSVPQALASDVSQPFSDNELSRSKKLPELASGELSRDSHELHLAADEEENLRGW